MGRAAFRFLLLIAFIAIPAVLAVYFTIGVVPTRLTLKETDFNSIEGWETAGHAAAFQAFLRTCEKLTGRSGFLIPANYQNEAYDRAYKTACATATEGADFYGESDAAAKGFFEEAFTPYAMRAGWSRTGKITGYYEPLMEASLEPHPDYPWPLYAAPGDQITLDLSAFREELSGTLTGRLEGSRLVPYYTRADIDKGALQGKNLEILYAKDLVDVYFLQVQGSGRAKLPDGSIIGVGYAGKNGHVNTLAGRTLVKGGYLELEDVSMQSIRQWFEDNPERIYEILHEDDSYVFFRLTGGDGPFGSPGAVLTPEHSIAVDPKFVPMGLPVFIDGEIPTETNPDETDTFQQILIAQDTGGAIRGELRADVFWGRGDKAEFLAGHMNNDARFTLLLPKRTLGDEK